MSTREIPAYRIIEAIRDLCIKANHELGTDVINALDRATGTEESPVGKGILKELRENAEISKRDLVPLCQDCGTTVIFIDIGQDAHITGGDLREAVNEGVKQGYDQGFLRKSICHPFTRNNTGTNTPAVIHFDIVPGNKIKIRLTPKGGGSENMSRLKMLTPGSGIQGVREFVIDTIREAGPNPCPPTVIGIGIGGNFERSAFLAKRALLREIGERSPVPELAEMEREITESVNKLGIGPAGYGGSTTSLDTFIEMEPCHIASLPVAVNINCHSARHKEAEI